MVPSRRLVASAALFLASVLRAAHPNPAALVAAPGGERLWVAAEGRSEVVVVEPAEARVAARWALPGGPTGLALAPDGGALYATLGPVGEGTVVELDPRDGRVRARWKAGHAPLAPVVVPGREVLALCQRFEGSVVLHALPGGAEVARIPVGREPVAAVASADGAALWVVNQLPEQAATAEHVAATVVRVDLSTRRVDARVVLPNGASSATAAAFSPDGALLLVTHLIGHYQLPTNQLERGWMNVNALTVIDTASARRLGTVLLDDPARGAANPWGVLVTPGGQDVVVAQAGTHELSVFPIEALRARLAGKDGASLEHDLLSMQALGRRRVALPGRGPRALAWADGRVWAAEYFTGTLAGVDVAAADAAVVSVALAPEPVAPDAARRGEEAFFDAELCFQNWQSCASCHPDARADGLNWDLLNDGVGNPKQTRSMVLSPSTSPVMALGVRAHAGVAVRAGFRFIQFAAVEESTSADVDAYLASLAPVAAPPVADAALVRRGEEVFDRIGCAECHAGPHGTDGLLHPIKHASGADAGRDFDTPVLRELWRTAPYLYDGRETDLGEAVRVKSPGARELPADELAALVAYLRTL
jgi:DNA-binding beta-propeller fold protein YncE